MQQYIGVAVPNRLPVMGNIDAAQSQRPAGRKPVGIVSNSNACAVRGRVSGWGWGDRFRPDYR
jgi:hypothetical protein